MLVKTAASSFGWNVAGSFVRHGASFAINIILARILGPEPYGLVAIAMLFLGIGNLIIDSGLNSGLIQKQDLTEKDVHYIFTVQLAIGILIAALISSLAPVIAAFYRQPEVAGVLQVLSITSILQAASQTSVALLKRRLQFDRIQHASVISYLAGYLGVGLWLVVAGYGVWGLVFAQLSTSALYLFLIYAIARHSIGLTLRDPGGVSKFGIKMLGTNVANWLISNYDNTAIGLVYGPTSLGLYTRAWTLAITPVHMMISSAQSVLFSASSKLDGSVGRATNTFVGIFTLFGITFFPFFIFESLAAHDLIHFLYGERWSASAPILSILSFAMPFFVLMALEGPVLAGLGRPEIELKVQWLVLGFTLIVLLLAINFPLEMIIWSVVAIYVFRFWALSRVTFRYLAVTSHDHRKVWISILFFSIVTAITVQVTGLFATGLPIPVRLLLQAGMSLCVWSLVFFRGMRHFLPGQVEELISQLLAKKLSPLFGIRGS